MAIINDQSVGTIVDKLNRILDIQERHSIQYKFTKLVSTKKYTSKSDLLTGLPNLSQGIKDYINSLVPTDGESEATFILNTPKGININHDERQINLILEFVSTTSSTEQLILSSSGKWVDKDKLSYIL